MGEIAVNRSIASLSTLLQTSALDAVALTEAVLEKIAGYADRSVFTTLLPERARAEAQAAAGRIATGRSLGPLDGIPFAWKDLFDTKGSVTTAASAVMTDNAPAEADAAMVSALAVAGMVSIGRTNLSEFAFSGLGINPHFGTPKNAASTDVPRIPGGSSSGSAVAVAAGLVPAAMGTDTGGSVRIPAAFNGIVGYKSTRGRYSMKGVFPLATSLDSLGPLTRTVQDAVWIDAAMRGLTASPIMRGDLSGLKLVVAETVVFDDAEAGVVAAFEQALERLSAAGATITRRAFPVFSEVYALAARHGPLIAAEAYALHRERLQGPDAGRIDQRIAARIRLGEKIATSDYIAILAERQRLIAEFEASFAPDELVVHPTVPHVAPAIAPLDADQDLFVKTNLKTLRNTTIGNVLDGCGVSIPCGTGDAGMPVGFLLSGRRNADEQLLSAALAAEAVIRGEA
ncbi:aspartyl-tRNA(Asn)/glutamyl-tRNA(Gln) amidotransferase subunit A [Pararhizobium capsulatum DSM 1112]|uniref:Indoleacetamide hydrolase n=1 Tax=Pararhizobium capsulatum DSM 1112 TaxID=1121113 RepID=A0ABU0BK88_9HYPH|nr:aspartyl-tRNA(Asn)/glutamyl-tRNA(Gln) amidotransferase subunit A [Pararhizobium capsulatum DSM 1112]